MREIRLLSTLGRYLRRRNRPEREKESLIKVELESSAGGAGGFALVLGDHRRIESGWVYAELARLIRVAENV